MLYRSSPVAPLSSLAFHLATTQSQNNLGDFCIPGTCTSLNSNCKRVGGSAFRCVCKEQYLAVNKTHCGRLTRTSAERSRTVPVFPCLVRVINASIDSTCGPCIGRGGVCLDEDADDHLDKCFCQIDSELCSGRTTTTLAPIPLTQPVRHR